MSHEVPGARIETVALSEMVEALSQTRPFAGCTAAEVGKALIGVEQLERVTAEAGVQLSTPGAAANSYWLVLEGELRVERPEPDGSVAQIANLGPGEGFGETPLLVGKKELMFLVTAERAAVLARLDEEAFWKLMAQCPQARAVILADAAQRLQAYQVEALHREKLVSLGTLAAGLMHELHNPGAAARRSASQLRANLLKLQQLSLRQSTKPKTQLQLDCMRSLLEQSMSGCRGTAMSSVAQADAEDRLAGWLAVRGVENAETIAPTLVDAGLSPEALHCTAEAFNAASFSDALNWLEALVSSVGLVCAIEESVTRMTELAAAVKKFAYDDRTPGREMDLHESLQNTLTILGHKLHIKQIKVVKCFDAAPAQLAARGAALDQVWTNLIDNAADASPVDGTIEIATWTEPGWLAVSVGDQGPGIPAEVRPHIFEPFFTTKPQGSGTGLGLEIVHRIVTQKFGGKIEVESEPGRTRFVVRLPRTAA
jgi:signal transduction histidine kinase